MNANIYRHEFGARLRSVVIWSLSLTALVFFFFSLFPALADQAAVMNEALAKFPPEMKAAFGMDKVDLSTVLGVYSFVFLFAQLCLAIQAANYGFGLVSIEESELTADFLLTKPVSRRQVLTSKLLAAADQPDHHQRGPVGGELRWPSRSFAATMSTIPARCSCCSSVS